MPLTYQFTVSQLHVSFVSMAATVAGSACVWNDFIQKKLECHSFGALLKDTTCLSPTQDLASLALRCEWSCLVYTNAIWNQRVKSQQRLILSPQLSWFQDVVDLSFHRTVLWHDIINICATSFSNTPSDQLFFLPYFRSSTLTLPPLMKTVASSLTLEFALWGTQARTAACITAPAEGTWPCVPQWTLPTCRRRIK